MRRILSYLLLILLMTSCVREFLAEPRDTAIEITLDTGGEMLTRDGSDGTMEGVDRYNENLISHVDFFFYPGGRTDADATYHVRRESGKRRNDVIRLEMTSEEVNTLIFPSAPDDIRTATVFAIVNYPAEIVPDGAGLAGTSLPELQALEDLADFVSPANHRQTQFLMSGSTTLNLNGRTYALAAAGTVELVRYACKLTVGVDVAETVQVGNEVWTPMLSGMEIYLVNGVSDVTLAGEKRDNPTYFSYRDNAPRFAYTDLQDQQHFYFEKTGNFYNTYPMYMYPQHWVYGSSESPDKEPYLKLVVPWVRQADPEHGISGTQRQFYYKIIIPNDRRPEFKCSFVRNNWYHIDIKVSILGSEADEAFVPIEGWCYVYEWQDKNVVVKNAEIGNARYLSVDRDSLDLRNISSVVNIGYTSSHQVVIQDLRVTRPYYGDKTSGPDLGGTVRKAGEGDIYPKDSYYLEYDATQQRAINGGNDWLHDTGTAIEFQHTLNNDYTTTLFDYSPYDVRFTLRHADRPTDPTFVRSVKVRQYPAVYISYDKNSDNTFQYVGKDRFGNKDNYGKKLFTSEHWGYVYVDNEQMVRPDIRAEKIDSMYIRYFRDTLGYNHGTNPEDYHWRVVWNTSYSTEIYRINVTVLPQNSNFVIGDPRSLTVDNLRAGWNTGPAMEGGERSLQWYYPAERSDRTINMMAPSYRISSKAGGIEFGDLTLDQAKWRCASYQEDGFPAGRWRLPTQGEIHFVATLCANKALSAIFSVNGTYWSANGGVKLSNGSVSNVNPSTALLRCVYDSWYWGEEDRLPEGDRDHFVWGDRLR